MITCIKAKKIVWLYHSNHSLLRSVILVSIVEVSLLIFKNFSMPGNLSQRNTEARSFTERGFHPPCSSVSLRRCGLKKHFSVLNL
jgi:hypothetical protein